MSGDVDDGLFSIRAGDVTGSRLCLRGIGPLGRGSSSLPPRIMVFVSQKIKHGKAPIAIDFDGVIHAYSKGFDDGTIYDGPTDGASRAIAELKKKYYIYIYSQRSGTPEGIKAVKDYLLKYDIPFDEISATKPPAKFFIDDKAIRFRNWKQTIKDVADFEKELELISKPQL